MLYDATSSGPIWMDEVRITKGISRSQGETSYTLDAAAFPDVIDTILIPSGSSSVGVSVGETILYPYLIAVGLAENVVLSAIGELTNFIISPQPQSVVLPENQPNSTFYNLHVRVGCSEYTGDVWFYTQFRLSQIFLESAVAIDFSATGAISSAIVDMDEISIGVILNPADLSYVSLLNHLQFFAKGALESYEPKSLIDSILCHLFTDFTWKKHSVIKIALLTSIDPVIEVSASGYERASVFVSDDQWLVKNGSQIANAAFISFPPFTASVVGWALYSDMGGDTALTVQNFSLTKECSATDSGAYFPVGQFSFSIL
jgi:hypothetical protein